VAARLQHDPDPVLVGKHGANIEFLANKIGLPHPLTTKMPNNEVGSMSSDLARGRGYLAAICI
jgi:hypothetical protein